MPPFMALHRAVRPSCQGGAPSEPAWRPQTVRTRGGDRSDTVSEASMEGSGRANGDYPSFNRARTASYASEADVRPRSNAHVHHTFIRPLSQGPRPDSPVPRTLHLQRPRRSRRDGGRPAPRQLLQASNPHRGLRLRPFVPARELSPASLMSALVPPWCLHRWDCHARSSWDTGMLPMRDSKRFPDVPMGLTSRGKGQRSMRNPVPMLCTGAWLRRPGCPTTLSPGSLSGLPHILSASACGAAHPPAAWLKHVETKRYSSLRVMQGFENV